MKPAVELDKNKQKIANLVVVTDNFIDQGLTKNGEAFAVEMLANWRPSCLIKIDGFLNILILKGISGRDAVWYFNDQGNFIGNSIESIKLPPRVMANALRALINAYLCPLFSGGVGYPALTKAFEKKGYFFAEIIRMLEFIDPKNFHLDKPKTNWEHDILTNLQISGRDVQDEYLLQPIGCPTIKIVIGEKEYTGCHSLVLNDMFVAYPAKSEDGSIFLLFESVHYNQRIAAYDFNLGEGFELGWVSPPWVVPPLKLAMKYLLMHCAGLYAELTGYLHAPVLKKTGLIRSKHLGHNLWNDLTALYRLEKKQLINRMDELIVFGGAGYEPWIAVEEFVKLDVKRINRNLHDSESLGRYIYKHNAFLVRLSDEYICKEVVDRLLAKSARICGQIEKKQADELRVVFGLRCENRTWINQAEGLVELAKYLHKKCGKLTIIVDGHDLIEGTGKVHASHLEAAEHNVLELEKDIVRQLTAAMDGTSVRIVDAVAMSLECSVAWIQSSDFFVAPWGAGLAKYKWVCNLPGVIFTSRWNLANKRDLGIYEDSKIREGATPCIYVDPEYIVDQGCEANVVASVRFSNSYANYFVDVVGIKLALAKLLAGGEERAI